MIVSHEARTLFVHVQKTGGVTVESTLLQSLPGATYVRGLPEGRHSRLGAAIDAHPEVADYWTFGFVRNPWARLFSWWTMIQRRGRAAERSPQYAERVADHAFWSGVLDAHPDFESFVLRGPEQFGRLRRPQLAYLRTKDRRADFIGRTESLDADLRTVLSHLGLPPPEVVPRKNAGARHDYREHYDDRMRDRVGELFAADIDEFGYEF